MDEFVWVDGERTIRFSKRAPEHAWDGSELLTTARAQAGISPDAAGAVLERPPRPRRAGARRRSRARAARLGRPPDRLGRGTGDRHRQGDRLGARRRGVRRTHHALGGRDEPRASHAARRGAEAPLPAAAGARRPAADGIRTPAGAARLGHERARPRHRGAARSQPKPGGNARRSAGRRADRRRDRPRPARRARAGLAARLVTRWVPPSFRSTMWSARPSCASAAPAMPPPTP